MNYLPYKNILLMLLFISVMACSARRSEPLRGALVMNDPHVQNGRKLFVMHCNKCHPHGEAGVGPALSSNPAPQFIKRFQVRHGLGVMPAFKKDEISKNELDDISRFMKALKRN